MYIKSNIYKEHSIKNVIKKNIEFFVKPWYITKIHNKFGCALIDAQIGVLMKIAFSRYLFSAIFFIIITNESYSQIGNWIQRAPFGGTVRQYAVGFSINNKGYIGTGWDLGDEGAEHGRNHADLQGPRTDGQDSGVRSYLR